MTTHVPQVDYIKVPLITIGKSSRTGLVYPREILVPALDKYFAGPILPGEVSSPRYEDFHGSSYEVRVMEVWHSRTSHALDGKYVIEGDIVFGYAKPCGAMAEMFTCMNKLNTLNFAMRSLIQTKGDVVTKLEIVAFDLTPDSLVNSKENIHVSRNGGRKVHAYRYMGFLGTVPAFMLGDLTEQYENLDELDYHQEKIEFYPESYAHALFGEVYDSRPMLVCNTGDWIVRRDRGGWYDTDTMTNEQFLETFHSEPLKG